MNVCLLLVAGSSSRLQGEIPKMLLPYKGKTLLQHSIDEIKKLPDNKLLVVTGCYHSILRGILQQQQIDWVQNEGWEKGMGSSIQKGIIHISALYTNVEQVIILVCDQPFLSACLLEELLATKLQTGKGIIASLYDDSIGTPVLFDKKYFDQLALLTGQYGAKKIALQFKDDMATVAFPKGAIDIDTPEDYEKLL